MMALLGQLSRQLTPDTVLKELLVELDWITSNNTLKQWQIYTVGQHQMLVYSTCMEILKKYFQINDEKNFSNTHLYSVCDLL